MEGWERDARVGVDSAVAAFNQIRRAARNDWEGVWEALEPLGWKNELGDWVVEVWDEVLPWQLAAYCCSLVGHVQDIYPEPLASVDPELRFADVDPELREALSRVYSISRWASYLPVMIWYVADHTISKALIFCDECPELDHWPSAETAWASVREVWRHPPDTIGALTEACRSFLDAAERLPERVDNKTLASLAGFWTSLGNLMNAVCALGGIATAAGMALDLRFRAELEAEEQAELRASGVTPDA